MFTDTSIPCEEETPAQLHFLKASDNGRGSVAVVNWQECN